jgi:DNA-directed RNA polymerase specialized sigma24 family protein
VISLDGKEKMDREEFDYAEWKADRAEAIKTSFSEEVRVVGMYLRDKCRAKEVAAATGMPESKVRNMAHSAKEQQRLKRERQRSEQKRLEIKRFVDYSQDGGI